MKIQKVCRMCNNPVVFEISREAYDKWKAGAHLQDVAPELTVDEREIMISGVCGNCFDKMFGEGE